jgi:hypothetical protein
MGCDMAAKVAQVAQKTLENWRKVARKSQERRSFDTFFG